ncbi:MAG: aldo/keto reductase [Verrucomicrobia bacterium]|nr:aldo/keto reductase [Verrucomicrobiota bacterium]
MQAIHRRHFLTTVAGSAAGLFAIAPARAAQGAEPPPPVQVPLGKTGIMLSRVGQGTGMRGGNRQSNHTRMGFAKLVDLFRHDYDHGVTFFDLADLYGSHVYFREALKAMRRDKVTILTKLWWRHDGRLPEGMAPAFQKRSTEMAIERFRQEIATDYLDIVLLHCLTAPQWEAEMQAYMEALSEAKERKYIRAVGVSCHGLDALKTAAKCPWVDVLLARTNPTGANMDGKPEQVVPVLREARANGKAILGMKVYGEGRLTHMKEECIRYAQTMDLIDAMTVGAETPEQMSETLTLVAKHPAAKKA